MNPQHAQWNALTCVWQKHGTERLNKLIQLLCQLEYKLDSAETVRKIVELCLTLQDMSLSEDTIISQCYLTGCDHLASGEVARDKSNTEM